MTKFATLSRDGAIDVVHLEDPRPAIDAIEIPDQAYCGFIPDGHGGWTSPPSAPPSTMELISYAATRRYSVETGGIQVDGVQIDTTRDSQAMISGALAYVQTSGATSVEFKAASGWITLSAEQVKAIALAVAAHVQRCFSAERIADEAITSGALTTFDQLDVMISGG